MSHHRRSHGHEPEHEGPLSGVVIESTADLAAFCDAIRDCPAIFLDTEFIGEESFYPKLCLVQVATPTMLALVDPIPFGATGERLQPGGVRAACRRRAGGSGGHRVPGDPVEAAPGHRGGGTCRRHLQRTGR